MDNLLNDYVTLIGGKKGSYKNKRETIIRPLRGEERHLDAGASSDRPLRGEERHLDDGASSDRPRYLESYEDYKKNILPERLTRNRQWVYDIFDGKKEKEKVLYQDSDFLLIPDIKWDGNDVFELMLVAFFKDKELHSMRDLNGKHIKLLEKVKKTSCKIINDKFELDENQLKIFFHYRPTVWQLHMHFHCLFLKLPSSSIERAHSIYSVIENLKLDTDYFKKVKIHCFNDN